MSDSLYYTYIVNKPSSEAFFVPNGFEANVEVHLWGGGGGAGSGATGGGGGYVKSTVTVAEGDFFEITVGGAGGDASGNSPGIGGSGAGLHSVSFAYGFGGGAGNYQGDPEDGDSGPSGGGGGATVVIINGSVVAAAGGGAGGGGYGDDGGGGATAGSPGGDTAQASLSSTTSGVPGNQGGAGASGGGGGGYPLGGGTGVVYGDDGPGGGGGYGGQSLGDLSIPGSDTTGGGRTTIYAPKSPPYGNAGYDGYAVLIFKRKYRILYKQAGDWKSVDKVWYKTPYAGTFSNVLTKTFSTVNTSAAAYTNTFTADTTFRVPEGVTSLTVVANGAGGGASGGSDAGDHAIGAVDGNPGNQVSGKLTVIPGQILNIVIGKAGVGGTDHWVYVAGLASGNGRGGAGVTPGGDAYPWKASGAYPAGGGGGGSSGLTAGSTALVAAAGGDGGGYSGGGGTGAGSVIPSGFTNVIGGGGAAGIGRFNSGSDGSVTISYNTVGTVTGELWTVPSGVKQLTVNYPTPDGTVTKLFPVTAGEVISVNLGDFGVDSTIKGSAGTLTLPAYNAKIFAYSGNVDHIIAQDVSVATDTGVPVTTSGSNATITAAAAAAGITYNVTYEGWHGDLGATIYFTPVKKSTIFQPMQVYVANGSGRQYPGAHTYQQQPTVDNNYIMNDYQGDYYGGEGGYYWETWLQQQGYVSITYDQAYAPGTWLPVSNVYYKDSDWKPLINNVDLKALVAKTLIYRGLTTETFTVPAGTTKVYARLIGGGGGGGGSYSTAAVRGLPGQIVQGSITVTPGDVLTVSVGGGGGGGEDYVPPAASGGGGGCKIICTKLHELGYLPDNIYAADELFGQWLRANDPHAYYGYVKWASVVVDWMDRDGPQCMFWIKDKDKRGQAQRELAIKWARRIATPWAEHMAYKMGVGETDNRAGRMIMTTGMWISRMIGKYTKTTEPSKSVALGYVMWATFGVFWLLAGIK